MTMPARASRDRDNFHARVFKAISLSETRIKSTYISGLPMGILLSGAPSPQIVYGSTSAEALGTSLFFPRP